MTDPDTCTSQLTCPTGEFVLGTGAFATCELCSDYAPLMHCYDCSSGDTCL